MTSIYEEESKSKENLLLHEKIEDSHPYIPPPSPQPSPSTPEQTEHSIQCEKLIDQQSILSETSKNEVESSKSNILLTEEHIPSPQEQVESHRKAWESGNIDYMGRDNFDNIWKKIEGNIDSSKKKGTDDQKVNQKPEEVSRMGSKNLVMGFCAFSCFFILCICHRIFFLCSLFLLVSLPNQNCLLLRMSPVVMVLNFRKGSLHQTLKEEIFVSRLLVKRQVTEELGKKETLTT